MNDHEQDERLCDIPSEIATLSACLQSSSARKEAKRHITADDFHIPNHAAIWSAMSHLDRDKQPVDPMSVRLVLGSDAYAIQALVQIMTNQIAVPDNVAVYANNVRGWATRRRLIVMAAKVAQSARNPDVDASGLSSAVAAQFAAVRDAGDNEDIQSITLAELLASPDDEPDWVIPQLLERRDRLILTGGEGLGKSFLLRQVAIMAASGLDPFDPLVKIRPAKVLIVDCENSLRQVKRKSRAVVRFGEHHGTGNPGHVNLLCTGRIDLLRDKDLSTIHREIDAIQPDIIVIGPIYAMSPKALMTDDDAVPVLAALDTMRETGAALLMEAHAGHASGADGRNFRPRGSASLMGWPEFGYGMKPAGASGYADLVPWRGDRDARSWPTALRHSNDGIRWVPHDGRGYTAESASWSPTRGMSA
ncbi:MAG: AAA family ATPase [Actinomycetia bacterium]|nr:AAA family ATPase [Actinomycetes bacterium]